jgi:hypothetical protein
MSWTSLVGDSGEWWGLEVSSVSCRVVLSDEQLLVRSFFPQKLFGAGITRLFDQDAQ